MTLAQQDTGSERATAPAARHAYLLGTPSSGSAFGQALGAHPSVSYLGAVDRLVHFPATAAGEATATCGRCAADGQPCPVWTTERIGHARRLPYGRLMSHLEAELGTPVLVDGSLHPDWLRAVLAARPADVDDSVAFLTVRSPFAFAHGHRTRTGCAIWQAANLWRDVHYDALRLAGREGLPLMVVRHEQFAGGPERVLQRASRLLGLEYVPEMRHPQDRPGHAVGGEHGPPGDPAADAWQQDMAAGELEMVLQTPGLADVANLLGYELSRDVTAWQRIQGDDA